MPKLLIIILLIGCGVGFAAWDMMSPPVGVQTLRQDAALQDAPSVTFTTLNGDAIPIETLRGRTTFLNIWATWCAPCIVEIPQLIELAAREDITLIALSVDVNTDAIDRFLGSLSDEHQALLSRDNIIIAHDPEKQISMSMFGTKLYPETYVITSKLKIKRKIEGIVDWLGADIRSLINDSNAHDQ